MVAANLSVILPASRRYTWRTHRFADGTYLTLKVVEVPEHFTGERHTQHAVYCRMYGNAEPELITPTTSVEAGREFLDREFACRFLAHTCTSACSGWSHLAGGYADRHSSAGPILIR